MKSAKYVVVTRFAISIKRPRENCVEVLFVDVFEVYRSVMLAACYREKSLK